MSVVPYPNQAGKDASAIPVRLAAQSAGSSAANPLYTQSSGSAAPASNANVTTVPVPASNASNPVVQALPSNAARKDAIFYNSNSVPVLLILGTQTPTQTTFTKSLAVGETWPLPIDFTGPIQALSTGAAGNIQVTELT